MFLPPTGEYSKLQLFSCQGVTSVGCFRAKHFHNERKYVPVVGQLQTLKSINLMDGGRYLEWLRVTQGKTNAYNPINSINHYQMRPKTVLIVRTSIKPAYPLKQQGLGLFFMLHYFLYLFTFLYIISLHYIYITRLIGCSTRAFLFVV